MTSAHDFFSDNEVFIVLLAIIILAFCGCCIKEYERVKQNKYQLIKETKDEKPPEYDSIEPDFRIQ
jgi:hypothetical protein